MGWKSSLFCLAVQAFERAIVMNGWDCLWAAGFSPAALVTNTFASKV
jgi:hypothetical protein